MHNIKAGMLGMTLLFGSSLLAQHEHHQMNGEKKSMSMPMDSTTSNMDSMPMPGMHGMTHAYSLHLPASRNASGTTWLPDASPMYMYMTGRKAKWMFHGNIFLRYTNTHISPGNEIGGDKFDAPNWFMTMLNLRLGKKGLFTARLMMSLDPLTEGGNGYPLLFQSGETYKGNRLVNRQHPHDLFSELSIGYTYAINKSADVFAYLGYPGEPALGAPAFMHRISAMNNPDAPLSHHWQDATHITFGTGTLGLRYRQFKLEGSVFTGREPDEERYNFDPARFDSYSYRLSYNPTTNWAIQFSQGFIKEPEPLEPGVDVTRTTASVLFSKKTGTNKQHDATLAWGMNAGGGHTEHSILFEDNFSFGKNVWYTRYEFVQKSAGELRIVSLPEHSRFHIHSLSTGYNRILLQQGFLSLAAGAQLTVGLPGSQLRPYYGATPVGMQVYLQLRPSLHR